MIDVDAEKMLAVRRQLKDAHDETLRCLLAHGRDFDDDYDMDFDWPYETFFRFDPNWESQDIACELTWAQWHRLLAEDWDYADFDETRGSEWEIAISSVGRNGTIYTFFEYVEPEASYRAADFWSLERWCAACAVSLAEAQGLLERGVLLAI